MLNGNILCKVEIQENASTILIPNSKKYRVMKVISDDSDDIPKDSIIYVPLTSGVEVTIKSEVYEIVHQREVILIL